MALSQVVTLSPDRFVLIYGVYLGMGVLHLVLGLVIYARGKRAAQKSRQRGFVVRYFGYISFSTLIACFYSIWDDYTIQLVGNVATMIATTLGLVNLMLFTQSVDRSASELGRKRVIVEEVVALVLALVYFPLGMSFTGDYAPVWSPALTTYFLAVSQGILLITFFHGIRGIRKISTPEVKKRLKLVMVGIFFLEIVMLQSVLKNGQIITSTAVDLLGIAILPGAFLLYLSIGRQLTDNPA